MTDTKAPNKIKKILWLTWKDSQNPLAGGAEKVNHELAKRLVADGYEVLFVVGGWPGAKSEEVVDGYRLVCVGSRFTVYWHAYKYYKQNLQGWADVVIDEINTIPFFAKFYVKEKNLLFIHQLAREIWFYEMFFPASLVGYLLEPIYLWILSDRQVITISESSAKDIARFGFKRKNIHIISEGIDISPIASLSEIQKYPSPTLLSLGSIRSMKRTAHIIQAFEIAKKDNQELRLIVAGNANSPYGRKVLELIQNSPFKESIEYKGSVSDAEKIELMQKSHALLVTSIKEGWGLVVTEANSQGTPAVVYNVDGLRDSVKNGITGIVVDPIAQHMAFGITKLIQDPALYATMQKNAWEWSKTINFDASYTEFKEILDHA
jgi:glycosyltransferase involved in cell wall biosynthesis